MKYFNDATGEVFAYETQEEREKFGATDLVAMTKAQVDKHLFPAAQPPQAPSSVTMRQARLALHSAGLLQSVDDAIAAMPEPDQTAARIEWDYASRVERSSQFVAMLGAAIGLDDAQMDELFMAASIL